MIHEINKKFLKIVYGAHSMEEKDAKSDAKSDANSGVNYGVNSGVNSCVKPDKTCGVNYYDEIAKGYNELHGDEQRQKAIIVMNELEISPDDELLDVGCGTGKITAMFPCKVQGIDPSKELIKQSPVQATEGRAEELPFPDKSFDIVISLTAIHNFDDYEKGISEMKRVSRRDIVISVLKKAKKYKQIEKAIKQKIYVIKTINEQHDVIFFAKV